MRQEAYAHYSIDQLEKELKTSINTGLSQQEASKRKKQSGLNALLSYVATSWSTLLIRQIKSPLMYLLISASILSFASGDKANGYVILLIIIINTVMGFIQEYRAEQALRLLANYLIIHAKVKRENKEQFIENQELVPGDIVSISAGDAVPADIRLVSSENLTIDESILTGESIPVKKDAQEDNKNIIFLGTTVTQGTGIGIVIATGIETRFGNISKLTLSTPHESNFQQKLSVFVRFLIKFALVMMFLVFILNLLFKGSEISFENLLLFSVALAISITPEALPLITTIALTQGALKLSSKKVIVKRLSALEDLGSITLLCSDKTGTLTYDTLSVSNTLEYTKDAQINILLACGISSTLNTNSFEKAAYDALTQDEKNQLKKIIIIKEIPFDPVYRRTTKLVSIKTRNINNNIKTYLVTKGVFENITSLCNNIPPQDLTRLKSWEQEQGEKAQRVLAIAIKEIQKDQDKIDLKNQNDLTLLGLIAFEDPIKDTAIQAIKNAQNLGIAIKILTGDSPEVATAIALKLGLISNNYANSGDVITGTTLAEQPIQKRQDTIEKCIIFARVTPDQKFEIIQFLKNKYTVGFLGDGINDAPALKAADVGIVVAHASQIAQSVADIVLTHKSLSTVIYSITIGRTVFANTFKYIRSTLSSNVGNFYSIASSSFFLNYLPMLPIQIMLLNLITDLPMLSLATDNVDRAELGQPTTYSLNQIAFPILLFGAISSFFDFLTFFIFAKKGPQIVQTTWFIMSLLTQLLLIFSLRTKLSIFKAAYPSKNLVIFSLAALVIGISMPFTKIGQQLFYFTKPASSMIIIVAILATIFFISIEIIKNWFYSLNK